ncbi:S41 family peptidase [Flavilitoribacter nigricans]|nr:S41 family peptidase [Flavilitoribacter nigricans]
MTVLRSRFSLWFMLTAMLCGHSVSSQIRQIDFAVKVPSPKGPASIGVRGDLAPLSWEQTFFLTDEDGDGIFTGSLQLETDKPVLQYKFVKNDTEFELNGDDNRQMKLDRDQLTVEATFDIHNWLSPAELQQIRFSPAAIREDIAVLQQALATIHPNLHRYITEAELEAAYQKLEQNMLAENDLPGAYKHITRFIAGIQCSHTITNPWNQPSLIKQALFYQPDRLPVTFNIMDGRIFIDKNASGEERLRRGVEVLTINGIPVREILERLLPYISADGGNDARRWYSLQLNGREKFEYFDILFPLEFPVGDRLELSVMDHPSGTSFKTEVRTLPKSERNRILRERYPDFTQTDDELWSFSWLREEVAYLRLGTFVTWHMEMDWEKFLEEAFQELSSRPDAQLIIDIRNNIGGADAVYKFILQRLLQKPVTMHNPAMKTAFQRIPDDLRPYINTWDDSVFDLGKKVVQQADGNYLSKPVSGREQQFKPDKNAFKGKTYLITNAANSSATHYMATYMKKYHLGTLVGRTTGGNQRGMNGGMIFFTKLPNTQIEVDIPIFGSYTPDGAPDGGIVPDIPINWTVEDLISGNDPDLNTILKLIDRGQ